MSKKLGTLINLLIRDRRLRERSNKPENADYIENQRERRANKKRIDDIIAEKEKEAKAEKYGDDENDKTFKELADDSFASGDFISGLFLSMLPKISKKDKKIERDKLEREELLEKLTNKQTELDKTNLNLKNSLRPDIENNKQQILPNTAPKENSEASALAQDSRYEKRDASDVAPIASEVILVDINSKAIRLLEGAFSKIKLNGGNTGGGGGIGDMLGGGAGLLGGAALGSSLMKFGMMGVRKIPLIAGAYAAYEFATGMTDDKVKKNVSSVGNKPIGIGDRLKSGFGEAVGGFVPFLDPKTVVDFMESNKLWSTSAMALNPMLGAASLMTGPLESLVKYFTGSTLEKSLSDLSETISNWWPFGKPKDKPPAQGAPSPVTGLTVPVNEAIDNAYTGADTTPNQAELIKKFVMSESSGKTGAINSIGAAGLGQFIPSTAKYVAEQLKDSRPDIYNALKDKEMPDISGDNRLKGLTGDKLSDKIRELFPNSMSTAVSKLSPEQQTAMIEQFFKPLFAAKPDAEFADIKAYGFASGKYPEALKKNDMSMTMYDKSTREGANAFEKNPIFDKWDTDRDGKLSAAELRAGSASLEPKNSKTSVNPPAAESITTPPKASTGNTPIRYAGDEKDLAEQKKTADVASLERSKVLRFKNAKQLETITENDLLGKNSNFQPTDETKNLSKEILKEFEDEKNTSKGLQNDIISGGGLFPLQRMRIRNMYETLTGKSSSAPGLSYDIMQKEIKALEKPPTVDSAPQQVTQAARPGEMASQRGGDTTIYQTNVAAGGGTQQANAKKMEPIVDPFNINFSRGLNV